MILENPLQRVQQPSAVTCGHACVSMVTGIPVEDIVSLFGNLHLNDELMAIAFANYGVALLKGPMAYGSGVAVHILPSLSKSGALHYIVTDTRDDKNELVLDPSPGTEWCQERLQRHGWAYHFCCLDMADVPKLRKMYADSFLTNDQERA